MKFNHQKFKELRISKEISIKEISNFLEKSRKTIWNWEKGNIVPDNSSIIALALILDVPVNKISDTVDLKKIEKNMNTEEALNILNSLTGENTNLPMETLLPIKAVSDEVKLLAKENIKLTEKINELIRLIDSVNSIIYMKDTDRKLLKVNKYFYNNMPERFNNIDVIGRRSIDIFGRKDIEEIIKLESSVFTSGLSIFNVPIKIPGTQNTEKGLISIVPMFDKSGEVVSIIVNIKEVTQIMHTIRHNNIIELIMNLLKDEFIWIWNHTQSQTVFLGKQVEDLTGWTAEELMEDNYKLFNENIHQDDLYLFDQIEFGKENSDIIYRFNHKNGYLVKLVSRHFKVVEDNDTYYLGICKLKED
ncbi:MAG TPA: PAS domain-containing protein [Victivallales bacterium]|nr:PAS domain-containing protein [Victivallales bacterium]